MNFNEMGRIVQSRINPKPQLLRAYQFYLVEGNTAAFVAALAKKYSLGTLTRMAAHSDVVIRRAAALALGLMGDISVSSVLGSLLSDADRKVRLVADDSMKAIWSRAGAPRLRQQLDQLSRCLECSRFEQAIHIADEIVAQGGEFPEAYTQRGLARYYLDDCAGAVDDCLRALEVNPFHYVAWIGMGHAYLEMNEPLQALDSFRHALCIYPDIESIRVQVKRLERAFQEPH